MTDDEINLSRRKILAGLGTIGVSAAGAGLGTTAFFSDQEQFANNQLVAGSLDMKVGWEEHYSDWSEDEGDGVSVSMPSGQTGDSSTLPSGTAGLPVNSSWLVAVDDPSQFMQNTLTNDSNPLDDEDPCSGADVPDDLQRPVINLDDVKPGDFGEVTFDFAICSNPGYVWLNGANVSMSENGLTEPEAEDDDEESGVVELADEIQTCWWYDDNGDNMLQEGGTTSGGQADVVIVMDTSGSMAGSKISNAKTGAKQLVDAVGSGVNVGVVRFSGSASTVSDLSTSKSQTKTAIDGLGASGSTDVGAGIDEGQALLTDQTRGARSGVNKVMVVLGNGQSSTGRSEATTAKNAGTTIYSIAYGNPPAAAVDLLEDISSPPKVDDGVIDSQDQFAFEADTTNISDVFDDIGGQIATGGEEVFFKGSLRDALDALTSDNGIPLDGDRSTAFDEAAAATDGDADDSDTNRECYSADTVHSIAFAWWLPINHGNEVQTDSVQFDVGFYTEQCRHNDGAGMANRPDA